MATSSSIRRLSAAVLLVMASASACADFVFRNWEDPDAEQWAEDAYAVPAFPKPENLIEFYVGAAETSKFYVDQTTLTPGGKDGVVRYVMVVKTAGGSTNISYEGIRCNDLNLRLYATGRADGTWTDAPKSAWKPMKNLTLNRHQGALARNYLCPNYVPIYTTQEGVNALRRGAHPDAPGQN